MTADPWYSDDEQYVSLLASLRIGMFAVNHEGRIMRASPTIAELLHAPDAESLLHTRARDLWPSAEEFSAFFQTLDRSGQASRQQCVLRRPDQSYFWAQITARALPSVNGGDMLFEFAVEDFSEHVLAKTELLEVARGVTSATDEAFFHSLLEHLARTLGATYAVIGEHVAGEVEKIRTIAGYARGWTLKNFEFILAGTPSARVIEDGFYACTRGLTLQFPDDNIIQRLNGEAFVGVSLADSNGKTLGLISVIFRQPIENASFAESMLKIFASRASAELERRQVLAQLEASERRFRSLIENAADGLSVIGEDGIILYTSPSTNRIVGFSQEDVTGQHFGAVIHPDDRRAGGVLFANVLQNPDKPIPFLLRRLTSDQAVRWIEGSAINLLHQPEVAGIVLNFRDVTERIEAEQRLRESEERFRLIAENIQDGLTVLQNGQVVFTSERMFEINGWTNEEMQQMRGLEFVGEEDRERVRQVLKETWVVGKELDELSFWIVHKDGTRRYIHNRYSTQKLDDNRENFYITTTDITEQKLAEAQLRFRADFERLIINISTRLINVRPDEMIQELETALSEVGSFLNVDRCHIFQFSPDNTRLSCLAEWSRAGIAVAQLNELQTMRGPVSNWWLQKLKAMEVFSISSTQDVPPEEKAYQKLAVRMGLHSVVDVPITRGGQLAGFLGVLSVTEDRHWSEDEISLLKLLAEIITNALERRESEARINQQLQNLASLHIIDRTITTKTEMQPVLKVLLEQVIGQLRVDATSILLYEAQNKDLAFGAGLGFRTGQPTGRKAHLRESVVRSVAEKRQIQAMSVPPEWRELWYDEGFAHYYAVPLVARDEIKGVLELFHRAPIEAGEEWLRFLTMLAEQAAIAIDNVTMFHNLQRSNQELSEAYDTTLEGWAQALELRDQETEGHSRRVLWLAEQVAEEMGIHGEDLLHMRRGALLHDIGKMGIPDSILSKPGPLTEEEWEIMRRHPSFAYELLSTVPFLRPALDIPYCHHEWWDGSGYPRGLRGEEIPLAARVFAVVDVWDALGTKRCYREAWDDAEVRAYLRDQSGKQFDPAVVEAFMRLTSGPEESEAPHHPEG